MPDKVIQIDGVGSVAFPDSMSDDQIAGVIQKQHPELHSAAPKSWTDQLGDFGSHAWGMLTGAASSVVHPIDSISTVLKSTADNLDKAKDAWKKGDTLGAVNRLKDAVPVMGPIARQAREEAERGDVGAAYGDLAGFMAAGKIAGKIGEGARTVAADPAAAASAVRNASGAVVDAAKSAGTTVAAAAGNPTVRAVAGLVSPRLSHGLSLVDRLKSITDAAGKPGETPGTLPRDVGADSLNQPVRPMVPQYDEMGAMPPRSDFQEPAARSTRPVGATGLQQSVQPRQPQFEELPQVPARVNGRIITPPPADTSGPIPGWKPTILESEQPSAAPTDARQVFKKADPIAQPDSVATVPTDTIKADPARFQFKANVGQGGAGEELRSVDKFDPEKSGILSVWKDPANGQTYVVNGHHRLELAQRAGAPNVTVRYLDAATAQEARTKGALINIAEGRGDSLDAAKVFRDTGLDADGLKAEGISLTGTVAKEGLALSKLDPKLFSQVVSGDLPASRAAIIGEGIPSPEDQRAFADVLDKAEKSGKRPTNDQVQEMIRLANSRPRVTETQDSLFGAHEISRGLISEAAEVSDYVRRRMGQESKLFATVGSERAATQLGENGNVIDAQANATTATRTSQAQALYDRLSTSSGSVNDALNRAAAEMAKPGANASHVKQMAYSQIKSALLKQADALTGTASAPETPAAAPEKPAVASGTAPAPATPQEPTTIPFSKPGMTKEVAEAKARTKKAQALATILHEGGISHERMVSDLSLKEQQLQLGAIAKGQGINQTGDMSPESVAETLFELRKLERKAAPAPAAKPTMMAPSPAYQKALQRPGALEAARALADAQR